MYFGSSIKRYVFERNILHVPFMRDEIDRFAFNPSPNNPNYKRIKFTCTRNKHSHSSFLFQFLPRSHVRFLCLSLSLTLSSCLTPSLFVSEAVNAVFITSRKKLSFGNLLREPFQHVENIFRGFQIYINLCFFFSVLNSNVNLCSSTHDIGSKE